MADRSLRPAALYRVRQSVVALSRVVDTNNHSAPVKLKLKRRGIGASAASYRIEAPSGGIRNFIVFQVLLYCCAGGIGCTRSQKMLGWRQIRKSEIELSKCVVSVV
jgi:hypothetical protein